MAAPEFEVVELTKTRQTIARRLTEAWAAPVFQLTVTADATRLVATRELMVELLRKETKPTVSDVLTRLVASALVRHRAVNARFVDGKLHRFSAANIGSRLPLRAASSSVIRDAERKSVQQIADDRADVVARARDGKLKLPDLEGGTFTISNLGMYGIEQFVAVLNPPQVAILAVGSIADRATAIDGEFAIVPTMTMTLTCDHRAIDGSEGARVPSRRQGVRRGAGASVVASFAWSSGGVDGRTSGSSATCSTTRTTGASAIPATVPDRRRGTSRAGGDSAIPC